MPRGQSFTQPPDNAPKPPELKYISFSNFKGMNTKNARIGLAPDELPWCENAVPVGPNNLISVPGNSVPLTTVMGVTWLIRKDVFLNGAHYSICFGTNGSGWQISKTTGIATQFAPNSTFSAPDLCVYRANRILIADPTAGYCTWDGTAFVMQGGVSPNLTLTNGGSSYTSAPTWTITGGSGSGASGTTTLLGTSVISLKLTNPGTGYKTGDVLTVVFAGGGGTGATANAYVWPFLGTLPVSIDVWQGQVWLVGASPNTPLTGARILQWSGIQSQDLSSPTAIGYDNFTNGGTGSTAILDEDLSEGLTAVKNLEGYLYLFGSNSVRQIGAKTVAGTPLLTNFTISTISSDQGTVWKYTIISFNKFVIFANQTGVFAIFGATVQKISGNMDGIFLNAVFGTLTPQSAVVDLFNKHIYVLLLQINDPAAGVRPVLVSLVDQSWFLLSAPNLMTITTDRVQSAFQLWGSFGGDITQLFSNSTLPANIKIATALTDDGDPINDKRALRVTVSHSLGSGVSMLTWSQETENGSNSVQYTFAKTINWTSQYGPFQFVNAAGQVINFTSGGYLFKSLGDGISGTGIYQGGTLTGSVVGLTLNAINVEWTPATPMRNM